MTYRSPPSQPIIEPRTSGIGDHGVKGVQDFISSHTCSHICLGLQLALPERMQITLDAVTQAGGEETIEEDEENSSEGE